MFASDPIAEKGRGTGAVNQVLMSANFTVSEGVAFRDGRGVGRCGSVGVDVSKNDGGGEGVVQFQYNTMSDLQMNVMR